MIAKCHKLFQNRRLFLEVIDKSPYLCYTRIVIIGESMTKIIKPSREDTRKPLHLQKRKCTVQKPIRNRGAFHGSERKMAKHFWKGMGFGS